MKKKTISLIVCLVLILLLPLSVEASPTYRYTTLKKTCLRTKADGKIVYRVPRNTRLKVIRTTKKWVRVKYKNRNLSVRKSSTNLEKLPSKKKSNYYINYLHTRGPVHWHGRKYTYYTSRALPIWSLPVPGLHLDKNGFFCDKNDYMVLGSSVGYKLERKVLATPFGKYGKVYDTGGYSTPSTLCDCATNW